MKTRQVYILSSPLTNRVYIGSTGGTLNERLNGHRSLDCTSREIINLGEYKISPLCVVENCSRKEIELKEKDYRLSFGDICVNYAGSKNSSSKEYKKPWELDGRKKAYFNKKVVCKDCGGCCSISSITHHKRSKKHQRSLLPSIHEP